MIKLKRGDIHPETGKRFWRYNRGYENWVTPEQFVSKSQRNFDSFQKWVKAHPDESKVHSAKARKKWADTNPEKWKKVSTDGTKKWRENNPEAYRISIRKSGQKRQADPYFRLCHNLRSRTLLAIKAGRGVKESRTQELLGAPFDVVREHLVCQFKYGMTLENHGEWEVHHIRPCHTFDLTDPVQQKECFNYKNLQPLWKEEHKHITFGRAV